MDVTDRLIVNTLQNGFPISERPFAEAAEKLGLEEAELIARLERLITERMLTRFGPLYNVERFGGAHTLAAMKVPAERFDEVVAIVNVFPEVAHNYERAHAFNMWFVVAAETPGRIAEVLRDIAARTGLKVYDMPRQEAFFLDLRFEA